MARWWWCAGTVVLAVVTLTGLALGFYATGMSYEHGASIFGVLAAVVASMVGLMAIMWLFRSDV